MAVTRCLCMFLSLAVCSAWLAVAQPALAQVDTAAAGEARELLRQIRARYASDVQWPEWSRWLAYDDLEFEVLAADRGRPAVLRQAVVELVSGRHDIYGQPVFVRLARALDIRAQELSPLPREAWASECQRLAESYQPVTVEQIDAARDRWHRRLDALEAVLPSVRNPGDHWNKFLYWPESRAFASPAPAPLPEAEILDRLEARWAAAPWVWDEATLYEASLAARQYIQTLRAYLAGETREQHSSAWNKLADLLLAAEGDEPDTREVARAVAARERIGQGSRLTVSIRREFSRPNLVLTMNRAWIESQLSQEIREPYQVNDVFAGTRSVGNGELVGVMRAEVLPSSAVGRWNLLFNGTSTARASGTQDRVRVVSRATTRIAATKPFRVDPRGLSAERALAGATTNIVYESIDSPGLPRRRSQAISETNARRPQAERESAAYARNSILERMNTEAAQVVKDFNSSYHRDVRDPRIHTLRPCPEIRLRADEQQIEWECLLHGPRTFGAARDPDQVEAGASVPLVLHVAASALEEEMFTALAGKRLTGEQLRQQMGAGESGGESSDADAFEVEFASEACEVRFADGAARVRLYVTQFDSADVKYPAMSIDVAYEPQTRDGQLVLVRQGRVRVAPLAEPGAETPKVSGRQQTLRLAVERKLAKVLTAELNGSEIRLPLAPNDAAPLRVEAVRMSGSWLQLSLSDGEAG